MKTQEKLIRKTAVLYCFAVHSEPLQLLRDLVGPEEAQDAQLG